MPFHPDAKNDYLRGLGMDYFGGLQRRLEEAEADRDRYQKAWETLMEGRLSTSISGDSRMVFDQFDYKVERNRRGHVTFDLDALDRAHRILRKEE